MDITKGKIGNALTSTASDHIVAVANDIYDEAKNKYQSELNSEFMAAKTNIEKNAEAIKAEKARAQAAEDKLRDGTTVRFDGIVSEVMPINPQQEGEFSGGVEIIYYEPDRRFVYRSDGELYEVGDSLPTHMAGSTIRTDKIYLLGSTPYVWNNGTLTPAMGSGSGSSPDSSLLSQVSQNTSAISRNKTSIDSEVTRAKGVEDVLRAGTTMRFDGIESEDKELLTPEAFESDPEIIYLIPKQKFVYRVGSTYYDDDGTLSSYNANGKIRKDKLYLLGATIYAWNGSELVVASSTGGGGEIDPAVLAQVEANTKDINGIKEALDYTADYTPEISNGTQGNAGNTTAVRLSKKIPGEVGKTYTIITNRPPDEGCIYVYGLAVYSSLEGGLNQYYSRTLVEYGSKSTINYVTLKEGEVGFNFVIAQWNATTETFIPLRKTSFDEYEIKIKTPTVIERISEIDAVQVTTTKNVNSLSATLLIGEMPTIVQMANGTLGNAGNQNCISTPARIAGTPGKTYIIKTNRPVADGCYYAYGYYTHSISSGNNYTNVVRSNPIDNKSKINTLTLLTASETGKENDEVAYSWTIAQVNTLTGAFEKLRISDFYDNGYYITIGEVTAIDNMATASQLDELTNMYARYRDREANVASMCRYRKVTTSPNKDYQFLIATDIHNSYTSTTPSLNSNIPGIVDALNFRTINSLFIMGDTVNGTYEPVNLSLVMDYFKENCPKPFYVVAGNHEVGTAKFIGACASHEQMYDKLVIPMVEAGCLVAGEYTEGVPYWYHDDATYKIRLIGLYEYDDPMDIDETYWKAIEYDSSLPKIAKNTSYAVGDKVNTYMFESFPSQQFDYKEHSFECVQACRTVASPVASTQAPSYKIQRGSRVIRQEQAQWFLDTLASTPANYGVIVLMHNPFSDTATSVQAKFTQTAGVKGSAYSQNLMQTDFIRNAVVAFIKGDNYNEDVIMKGDAAYLNKLEREPSSENDGYSYAYNVSKDFSTKNSGVTFLGFIGGHTHKDYVWKDATENIYQVSPCCSSSNVNQQKNSDISCTPEDASLTVVSLTSSRIAMAKIGANVTIDGKLRDYEVITK